jgi:hypothetical protein
MAFLVGLAAIPMASGAYWLLDALLPERAWKSGIGGWLGEIVVLALLACVIAGVLAQLSTRRLGGWLPLVGGLLVGTTVSMVLGSGETGFWLVAANLVLLTAFLGAPASVAYVVTFGLRGGRVPGEALPQPATGVSALVAGRYWDGTRWLDTP